MTLYIALLGLFLIGYSIIHILGNGFSVYEKIGFSFITGVGVIVFCMVIFQFAAIPITATSLGICMIVLLIVLNIKAILDKSILKFALTPADKIQFSFAWFFFAGLILYFLYGIISKGLYWPTAEYDTLAGW